MKLFEAIKFNLEVLNRLISAGFKTEDCRFIALYADYKHMRSKGEKVTYIISALAVKYSVSERKVYSIIKHMETDCTPCAV